MALIEQVRRFLIETEKSQKKPLVVILGPTASGKTAFSLRLALEIDGEVISADSRQIYRDMDIGTDKIAPDIRAKIPHHLIDIRDPDQSYSLSDFQRDTARTIDDMKKRADLVPLKRGGEQEEAAALIIYLLSGWAQFITGQMIPLTGGDWL